MKNVHHWLPHAFPVALWEFLNPQGNVLELGLDLDDRSNFPYTKEKCKALKVSFSFVLDYSESEKFQ